MDLALRLTKKNRTVWLVMKEIFSSIRNYAWYQISKIF